ncbi:Hypothetical predicted protein [Pelobates cultripes]|uniref:Uncharacterized protein n=1 Tax=Pelobates cultripes TaxID=61616 RepID=A0AAD1VZ01_PELCU|nr:Hypothetical predicted protein [Pelobates cultripes]
MYIASPAPVDRGSSIAIPSIVFFSSGDGYRPSISRVPSSGSRWCTSSSCSPRSLASHSVVYFREPWSVKGVSQSTPQLIKGAPNTRQAYKSAWSRWHSWCMKLNLNPISAPFMSVLHFSDFYDEGKAYRTVDLTDRPFLLAIKVLIGRLSVDILSYIDFSEEYGLLIHPYHNTLSCGKSLLS